MDNDLTNCRTCYNADQLLFCNKMKLTYTFSVIIHLCIGVTVGTANTVVMCEVDTSKRGSHLYTVANYI